MRKIFTKLIGVTLGLAMAVGVGVGVAANNRAATKLDAVPYSGTYELVDDVSDLTAGDTVIMVNTAGAKALSTISTTNTKYGYLGNVTVSNGTVTLSESSVVAELTLRAGNSEGSFAFEGSADNPTTSSSNGTAGSNTKIANGKYLTWTSGNSLNLATSLNNNCSWTLSYSAQEGMIISNVATSARHIRFGNGDRFATYQPTNDVYTGTGVNLFKKNTNTPSVSTTPTSLFFRIGGSSQSITADASNFSGAVSYSWAFQSGTDCVDLSSNSGVTISMTPKNSIVALSTGVYRVTASYSSESAFADVSVTVDKGGSACPYTVAEARAAYDEDRGLENAYVKGVVYRAQTFNDSEKWITYWISDNGSETVPFEIYKGKGVGGANFSALTDIKAGDIVVVKGDITKYNSTYEFSAGSQLISQIHVASIDVKTAPTKVAYNSEDCFDPTGLVVTATYDDTPNPTTMDFAYADLEGATYSAFSFNPSTTTALTNETSVSITLFGKTTTQAITVTVRAITGVTLSGDMTNKAYVNGDDWDLSGLYLSIAWNVGTPNPTTVNLTQLTKDTDYTLDKNSASEGDTSLYIQGEYEGFAFSKTITGITVTAHPFEDAITYDKTAGIRGNSTSSWGTDNDVTDYTGASYRIHSMGVSSNTSAVRWNASGFLYAKSSPVNAKLKTVSVASVTSGKTINVYGSNTPYSGAPTGDPIATLSSTSLSYAFENVFKYIALKGTASSTEVGTITIAYEAMSAKEIIEYNVSSTTSLYYQYHKDDGGNFTYSNVALRFGALLDKTLWAGINNIEGYGVLVSTKDEIGTDNVKDYYDLAEAGVGGVDYFYKPLSQKPEPSTATAAQKGDLEGDYYIWNVFYNIPSSALTDEYIAVAFIKTTSEIIFMQEIRTSAAKIAHDLIEGGTDAGSAEGSLQNLANQYSA